MLQAILARIDEDSVNLSRRGKGQQISDEARAGLGHPRNRRGEDEIATILASKYPILASTVSRMTQTRLAMSAYPGARGMIRIAGYYYHRNGGGSRVRLGV